MKPSENYRIPRTFVFDSGIDRDTYLDHLDMDAVIRAIEFPDLALFQNYRNFSSEKMNQILEGEKKKTTFQMGNKPVTAQSNIMENSVSHVHDELPIVPKTAQSTVFERLFASSQKVKADLKEMERRNQLVKNRVVPLEVAKAHVSTIKDKPTRDEVVYQSKDFEEKISHLDTTFEMLQKTNRMMKNLETKINTLKKDIRKPTFGIEDPNYRRKQLRKSQLVYDFDFTDLEYRQMDRKPSDVIKEKSLEWSPSTLKKERAARAKSRGRSSNGSIRLENTEDSPTGPNLLRSTFTSLAKRVNTSQVEKRPLNIRLPRSQMSKQVQLSAKEKEIVRSRFEGRWGEVQNSVQASVGNFQKTMSKIMLPHEKAKVEYVVETLRDAKLKKEFIAKAGTLMQKTMEEFIEEKRNKTAQSTKRDSSEKQPTGRSLATERKDLLEKLTHVVFRPQKEFTQSSAKEIQFYEKKMLEMRKRKMEAPKMNTYTVDENFRNLIS